MTTAYSGVSVPANHLVCAAPVIERLDATTAMETGLVFGTADSATTVQAFEAGAWVALDPECRLRDGAFWYPAILKTGANAVRLRAVALDGAVSAEATGTITRKERKRVRPRRRQVKIGTTDVTRYAHEVQVEDRKGDGILRLGVKLRGYPTRVTTADTLTITADDGAAATTRTAPVLTVERTYEGGNRVQAVTAQGEGDALPRLVLTCVLPGDTNGDVLDAILRRAGYATVYAPAGARYTGPRALNKKPAPEVVDGICFVEDWILWPLDATAVAVLPSHVLKFVFWTFADGQVTSLAETEDRAFLLNRARAVYQPLNEDLNVDYKLGERIPDKSAAPEGCAWYTADDYATSLTGYTPNSVLFFGAWGPGIDWTRIDRAVLKLKFANTPNQIGGTLFSYNVDLEAFPEKQFAAGFFDLRPYHLPAEVPVYYSWSIVDRGGAYLGNGMVWSILDLKADTDTNFQQTVTTLGVHLTEPRLVGTVVGDWTITTDPASGPREGDAGVIWSRYDKNGDTIDYTWYTQLDADDLALHTVTTDADQAAASHDTGREAHLLNCTLVTQDNQEYNGNPSIYGVISHTPNTPIRRVDALIFKFTATARVGQTISCRFSVWGRTYQVSADDEDAAGIDLEYTNDPSRAAHGLKDGGCLVSGYWGTRNQAYRRLKKFVDARAVPIVRETLKVPGSAEMRAGQLIRLFTRSTTGAAYNTYAVVTAVAPGEQSNTIEALRAVTVPLSDTAVEPVAPNVAFGLTDAIRAVAPVLKTLQFGVVAAMKYRGMFRVTLESGQDIEHVIARIAGVKSKDRVAVLQSAEGTWVIVDIVTASTENSDLAEKRPPADVVLDGEKIIDDSIPGADALRQQYADANNRYQNGRPMPNFITVEKLETTPAEIGGEIPFRGWSFTLKLSHDVLCRSTRYSKGDRSNDLINFVYLVQEGDREPIPLQAETIGPRTYQFTPRQDLAYGKKITLGLATITGRHPNHLAYRGPEILLYSKTRAAELPTGTNAAVGYTVEPQFLIQSITVFGPGHRRIRFQGTPVVADALVGGNYRCAPDPNA